MDTSFRPEVRQTAVGLVKQLSNKNVMLIFYFFYDVLDVIETSSLQFQKRYGLLVDQCKNIEDMTSSLRKIGSLCGGHQGGRGEICIGWAQQKFDKSSFIFPNFS